jgi:hypothetical protein
MGLLREVTKVERKETSWARTVTAAGDMRGIWGSRGTAWDTMLDLGALVRQFGWTY